MVCLRLIILVHATDWIYRSPGRFLATNNLKVMLAYLLMNYDVKMAGDEGFPPELFFGINSTPDPRVKMMFRKRQT